MRATVMYGAGDVRVENVPDARLIEPTDALVVVTRAAICGSDLWPYKKMENSEVGRRMGHDFIGVVEAVGADVRKIKVGDLVAAPFAWSDGTCDFVRKGFTPPACMADFGAAPNSMADRAKRCASRKPMDSLPLPVGEIMR